MPRRSRPRRLERVAKGGVRVGTPVCLHVSGCVCLWGRRGRGTVRKQVSRQGGEAGYMPAPRVLPLQTKAPLPGAAHCTHHRRPLSWRCPPPRTL